MIVVMSCFLNHLKGDYSNFSEILSKVVSYVLLFGYVIWFPLWLIRRVILVPAKTLREKHYLATYGSAYMEYKLEMRSRIFELLFIARRFVLICSVLFLQSFPVMQWIIYNYFSIAVSLQALKFFR